LKDLIRKILKEEFTHPNHQKFLDWVVSSLLESIFILPSNNMTSFGTVSEMEDTGVFDVDLDRIRHEDKYIKQLGWDYYYDPEDEDDEGYYYRINNPKQQYDSDEFYYEIVYDWLDTLVEKGVLGFNEDLGDHGEWVLREDNLTIKSNFFNFICVLFRTLIEDGYVMSACSKIPTIRISIMNKINNTYDIDDLFSMDYVVNEFFRRLPYKLKDMGVKMIIPSENKTLNESIVDDFIEFGKKELSLGDGFRVNLTDNGDDIETLANYDMIDGEINVLTRDRATPDIIRSIAHEMVHHKQNERGDLRGNPEEGEDGSPWEDEANAKAGELLRVFGKQYPEIYDI
jgi:hypothetical protein